MADMCTHPCPDIKDGKCPFKKHGDNFPETDCPYVYCPYYEKNNLRSSALRV